MGAGMESPVVSAAAHDLVRDLQAREAAGAGTPDRPWYIGVLLGTAGWFAGVLLLVFVGALFRPDSGPGALVVGAVLVGAAWGLFKADREGAFFSQLALALSIAGQFALLYGIHESLFKGLGAWIPTLAAVGLVIQLALVAVMPSSLHRTMSTLFACIAWAMFVRYGLWDEPFWSQRKAGPGPSLGSALFGWALVWVPVGGALYFLVRREPQWMAAGRQALARPVAVGLIASLAVATLLSHPFETFTFWAEPGARKSWLALWPLLSALASLGALAAAFALGNRGLMAVCIVAALLHMSHFYYAMGATLIVKSILMIAMGAGCLAAARYLGRGHKP